MMSPSGTILIVHGSEANANRFFERFAEAYAEEGRFVVASGSEDALRICRARMPDCLITDYLLRDGTGLDLLRKLRESSVVLPCPVLLLTVHNDPVTAVEAIKQGAWDYQVLPGTTPERLMAAVKEGISAFGWTGQRPEDTAFQARRQWIHGIAEASPNVLYIFDLKEHRNVYTNGRIHDILGISPAESQRIGDRLLEVLMHPEDLPRVRDHLSGFSEAENGEIRSIEYRMRHSDDSYRWFRSDDVIFSRDSEGRPHLIAGTATDITVLKQTEEALRRHAERQTLLLDCSKLLSESQESDSEIVRLIFVRIGLPLNIDLCLHSTFAPETRSLRTVAAIGIPEARFPEFPETAASESLCRQSAEQGIAIHADAGRIETDDAGRYVRFLGVRSYACYPLISGNGTVFGTFAVGSRQRTRFLPEELDFLSTLSHLLANAFERRRIDSARRESEERFRRTFEQAAVGIAHVAPDGRFLRVNQRLCDIVGYSRDVLLARAFQEITHPDDLDKDVSFTRRLLSGEIATYSMEKRYLCRDGAIVWVQLTVSLARATNGQPDYFISVVEDISERKRNEAQIVALNSGLEQRVADRTAELAAAIADAERARAEAETANQAKSEFLSRMSHELRTPLNSILGFAQVMEMQTTDRKLSERIGRILQAGRHLLQLINEVLDIARVESGRLALSLEPVRVGTAVTMAVDLISPLCSEKGLHLSTDFGECEALYVLADQQRLIQVILNLLANAVKYNRSDGHISVTCERWDETYVRIRVRDTGVGIAEENLPRLFQPFERLGVDSGEIEGTGLGLALSKSLTEAMNGKISVHSRPGIGSTFCVDLPLTDPPSAPAPVTPGEVSAPENETEHTVLCIEDNPANLSLIREILDGEGGYRLITAEQGAVTVALAREHHPSLILLDLHLPDIPGEEVLRRLKNDAGTARIPVIILSADNSARLAERLRASGAADFLPKPLDLYRFLQRLREVIGRE
ncbi:MAG: PAS domain S-box protein [Capsulimonadales bacterium]|nr:PAS domain S-box protein [Capsulimonadales bacterium]